MDISQLEFDHDHAVVHLAGKAHDTKRRANEQEYFDINTELSKVVFDCFLQSNSSDFIFLSSVKAVADSTDTILTEDAVARPLTANGKSKLAAEEYMLSKVLPKGKRLLILRPCMVHGPGNKGNLNLLYKFVSKGIPYPLAAFDNKRSFLGVANLCFVIHQLLEHKSIGSGIYNVADDKPISTNEVVQIISEVLDKPARLWRMPKPFIRLAATFGTMFKLPFNSEHLDKLTENFIVSNNKIKTALHIDALPYSVEENLKKTINCFRTG